MFDRRQLGTGVISQGLSSLTNFLLVVAVARVSDPQTFGGFAIAYSITLVFLGIGRGFVGEPLSVTTAPNGRTARARAPMGASIAVGIVAGVLMAVGGAGALATPVGWPLLAFGLGLPFLLLQDAVRFVGFAASNAALAVRSDTAWLIAQVIGFTALAVSDVSNPIAYIATWALSAGLAAAAAFPSTGMPRLLDGLDWLRHQRDIGIRFAGEFTVGSGASHATLYIVAGLAGLPAAGALRAAESLYGPLNSLLTGLQSVLLPAAAERAREEGRHSILKIGAQIGSRFAGLALVFALVLVALPDWIGEALLGSSWAGAALVLLPLGLRYFGGGLLRGLLLSLKAARAATSALVVRGVTGIAVLGLGGIGAALNGAVGAAVGMAMAQVPAVLAAMIAVARTRRTVELDSATPTERCDRQ